MSIETCLAELRAMGAAIVPGSLTEKLIRVAYSSGVVDGGRTMAENVNAALDESGATIRVARS